MADWIGFTMALLGAVLVLAGSTLIFLHARSRSESYADADLATAPEPAPSLGKRLFGAVRALPEADRLIGWGLALLFFGALAAGAIKFGFAFELGTFNANVAK